jgi:hypothetical protein
LPSEMVWAKATMPEVRPNTRARSAEEVRAETAQRVEGFEQFNVALNEFADRMDWCGDYEEAVSRIGMKGRRDNHPAQVRLTAIVTVTVEITDDSPSYRIDSAFQSEYDVSEVTSLTATVTSTTRVEFVVDWDTNYSDGWDSDLDASDFITGSEVEDSLDGRISGSWTLEDWSVDEVTESEDQEF